MALSWKNDEVMKVQEEGEVMPNVSKRKCNEKEREHIAQEKGSKIDDGENSEVCDGGFLDAPLKGSNRIGGDEEDKLKNRECDVECEGEKKKEKREKKEKDEKKEKEGKDKEEEGKDKDLKEGACEYKEKKKEKKKEGKEAEGVENEGKELKEQKEKKKEKKAKKKEEEEEEKESKDLKKKKDDDKAEKEKETKKDGEKDDDEKEEKKKEKKDKKKDKKEPKKSVEKLKKKLEKIEAKMQNLVLKKEECLKMLSEADAKQMTSPQEAQPGMTLREGVVEIEKVEEKGPCAAETISNTKLEVTTVEGCDAAIPMGAVSSAVDETVTILAADK